MANKQWFSPTKAAKMRSGAQLFLKWYEDVIRQGLQYLEQESALIHSIAKQLVDSGNGSMARQIRILADQINQLTPEECTQILSRQALIARCLVNLKQFSELEQLDILHLAGLSQRKKELEGQDLIQSRWTILGLAVSSLENLTERKVYLQSQETGKIALFLDYAFRSSKFETNWQVGKVYDIQLQFYPSSVPLRAVPESYKMVSEKVQWRGIKGWVSWATFRKKQVNAHPWLFSFPAVIKDLQIAKSGKNWGVSDPKSQYFLTFRQAEDAERLAAFSLGQPFHIFGVWDTGRFEIYSLLEEEQIIPLENNIWIQ